MNVSIVVEGVLAKLPPEGGIRRAALLTEGQALLVGLGQVARVSLLSSEPREDLQRWLDSHGVSQDAYSGMWCHQDSLGDLRTEQLGALIAAGLRPALFISANPLEVKTAMELGLPALLFVHPVYQRPEFRPDADTAIRAWDELEDEMDRQNALRAAQQSSLGSRFE